MASSTDTVAYILEQTARAGAVSARKMFGEYGLFLDGKMIAIIADDQLYLKITDAGRALLSSLVEGAPYPGAKPWFLIGGEEWDDADFMTRLMRATADAMPAPKKAQRANNR